MWPLHDGLPGTSATAVVVNNVAPVITTSVTDSSFCGGAAENETVTATLKFDDPGTVDTHTVEVNWGDGQSDTILLVGVPTDGTRELHPTHEYAAGGVYEVSVKVTDDDQGVDESWPPITVVVSGVGVVGNTLYVIGTPNDDHVTITQTGKGTFKVHADFLPDLGGPRNVDPAGVEQINVFLYY